MSAHDDAEAGTAASGHSMNVRVAVRCRPLIAREKIERCSQCVSVLDAEKQVVIGKDRAFTFDHTFGPFASQADIHEECVVPLVDTWLEGYNATIFAYGQTGSGKTFTMGSCSNMHVYEEEEGIIQRVAGNVFDRLNFDSSESSDGAVNGTLKVQFLEIYGDDIRDLLDPAAAETEGGTVVQLREAETGEVQVQGASCHMVRNTAEAMRFLEQGTLCRTTASTLMNTHSSRSHAIFTFMLEQRRATTADGPGAACADSVAPHGEEQRQGQRGGEEDADDKSDLDAAEGVGAQAMETRTSRFHFVDLAGSERQKRTGNTGQRLREGIMINQGLLALGNVISALGDPAKRGRVHVPYRDSKLTRMLQDSLGGNSRTLMLACVSPADTNLAESLSTLKYANRARNIRNKPVLNVVSDPVVAALQEQLRRMQAEVLQLRGLRGAAVTGGGNVGDSPAQLQLTVPLATSPGARVEIAALEQRCETAEAALRRAQSQLGKSKLRESALADKALTAQAEADYYKMKLEEMGVHDAKDAADGADGSVGEEKQQVVGVLKRQLGRIAELEAQLQDARAAMTAAPLASSAESGEAVSQLPMLAPAHTAMEEDDSTDLELIRRARAALEDEKNTLKKMASDVTLPTAANAETIVENGPETSNAEGKGASGEYEDSEGGDNEDEGVGLDVDGEGVLDPETEAEEQRIFRQRQRNRAVEMEELASGIEMKKELVERLEKSRIELDKMRTFYEGKVELMAVEVRELQQDREKLLEEVGKLEASEKADRERDRKTGKTLQSGAPRGKSDALVQLQRRLRDTESQLTRLREKQAKYARFMRAKQQNETQIRMLSTEIAQMKRQKAAVAANISREKRQWQTRERHRQLQLSRAQNESLRDRAALQAERRARERAEHVLRQRLSEARAQRRRLEKKVGSAVQGRVARNSAGTHGSVAESDGSSGPEPRSATARADPHSVENTTGYAHGDTKAASWVHKRISAAWVDDRVSALVSKHVARRKRGMAARVARRKHKDMAQQLRVACARRDRAQAHEVDELNDEVEACKAKLAFAEQQVVEAEGELEADTEAEAGDRISAIAAGMVSASDDDDAGSGGAAGSRSRDHKIALALGRELLPQIDEAVHLAQAPAPTRSLARTLLGSLIKERLHGAAREEKAAMLHAQLREARAAQQEAEHQATSTRIEFDRRLIAMQTTHEQKLALFLERAESTSKVPAPSVEATGKAQAHEGSSLHPDAGTTAEADMADAKEALTAQRVKQLQVSRDTLEAKVRELLDQRRHDAELLEEKRMHIAWLEFEYAGMAGRNPNTQSPGIGPSSSKANRARAGGGRASSRAGSSRSSSMSPGADKTSSLALAPAPASAADAASGESDAGLSVFDRLAAPEAFTGMYKQREADGHMRRKRRSSMTKGLPEEQQQLPPRQPQAQQERTARESGVKPLVTVSLVGVEPPASPGTPATPATHSTVPPSGGAATVELADTPVMEDLDTNTTTPEASRVFVLDVDDAGALEASKTPGIDPESDALNNTNTSLVDAFEGLETSDKVGKNQGSVISGDVFSRLTDPSSFTGTHKQRDRGRGGRRRSATSTTPVRASPQPSPLPAAGQSTEGGAASASASVFNRLSHPSSFTGTHRERGKRAPDGYETNEKEEQQQQQQQQPQPQQNQQKQLKQQETPDTPGAPNDMNDSPRHAHAKALGLVSPAVGASPAKAYQSTVNGIAPSPSRNLMPASPAKAVVLPRHNKSPAIGKNASSTRRVPPPPPPLMAATGAKAKDDAGTVAPSGGLAYASESAHRAQDAERRRRSSIRDERLDRLRSVGSRLDDLHRQMSRLEASRGCRDLGGGTTGSPSATSGVDPMVAAERAWEGALREGSAGTQEEKENSNEPTNRRRQVEI